MNGVTFVIFCCTLLVPLAILWFFLVKNMVEIIFDNHPNIEQHSIEYSNTEVMLFAPDQEEIIDKATYVLCINHPTGSYFSNSLVMAPAKNCTVKHAEDQSKGERIMQISIPDVLAGEPATWKLTWALSEDEYEGYMMGVGKWLVDYQH